jgi:hypothetical protein
MQIEPTAKKQLTGGERLFNALDYYGLGWVVNAAIGVASSEVAFNNSNFGRIGFLDHALDNKNVLFYAREKAVDGAVNIANTCIDFFYKNHDQFETLAKDVGERLVALGADITPETIASLQKLEISKSKEAFFELYDKLGTYEGIAATLGEGFEAAHLKEAADYLIKKQTSQEVANKVAVLATLCIGGFAVMIPMKMMEDNKRWLVEHLDKHVIDPINSVLGNAPQTEQERAALEEKRQARYREIEEEPQQTWGTMLKSRLGALIPVYALHMAWWNQNNVVKYAQGAFTGQEITNPDPTVGFGGAGHYATTIGEAIENNLVAKIVSPEQYEKLGASLKENAKPFVERLAGGAEPEKLARLSHSEIGKKWLAEKAEWFTADYGYSFIAASGTFALTRFFGNKQEEKEKKEQAENNIVPFNRMQTNKMEHKGAVVDSSKELAFT